MKRIVVVGLVVVIALLVIVFLGKRFSMDTYIQTGRQDNDLTIINDSSDTISVEYKESGKDVNRTVQPQSQITGGKGFIRIFTAKKNGAYELSYTYPRPVNSLQKVTLSQVTASAQKKGLGDEMYTEKGMIGDIKIGYEEVRNFN